MHDFTWYNPTRVVFGRGAEADVGAELIGVGVDRVLIIHGMTSIYKRGLHGRIMQCLSEDNISTHIESGNVTPNPTLQCAKLGISIAREHDVEAILAVGGGSVIDVAKAIAVGYHDPDIWPFFTGDKKPMRALPIYCIPTISGSGSEFNGGCVLTNEETKQKFPLASPLLYPKLTLVNPELMYTVNKFQTACGAVDAMVHAVEATMTAKSGSYAAENFSLAIFNTLCDSCNTLIDNPTDYEARAAMAWASMMAASGIGIKGLSGYSFPIHMIAHSLSALYGTVHGAAVAVVFLAWCKWCGEDIDMMWTQRAELPTSLTELGIPESDIPAIAENAMGLSRLWKMDDVYTQAVIEDILRLAV
jgi:hypothetical protein